MSGVTQHFIQAAQIEKLTNRVDALERELAELKRIVVDSQHGARPLIPMKDRVQLAIDEAQRKQIEKTLARMKDDRRKNQ